MPKAKKKKEEVKRNRVLQMELRNKILVKIKEKLEIRKDDNFGIMDGVEKSVKRRLAICGISVKDYKSAEDLIDNAIESIVIKMVFESGMNLDKALE